MYRNTIMKPIKIVGKEGGRYIRVIEGVNLVKVHYYMLRKREKKPGASGSHL
jgi:hypothetical protein